MKTILKHRVTHYAVVLVVLVFALYTYFVATPEGEAVEISTIGTVTVSLIPNPSSVGTESFTISYSGVGFADISGWEISNGTEVVYTFPTETVLESGGVGISVCADSSGNPKCGGNEWAGGAKWDDVSGSIALVDAGGVTVVEKSYTNPEVGAAVEMSGPVEGNVLTNKDSIQICHATGGGKYSSPQGGIGNITGGQGGHGNHTDDIIPSFFYLDKGKVFYYGGLNWPDETGIYDNNCS